MQIRGHKTLKVIGIILLIAGFICSAISGSPRRWGVKSGGMPVWKHLLLEIAGFGLMIAGVYFFKGKL